MRLVDGEVDVAWSKRLFAQSASSVSTGYGLRALNTYHFDFHQRFVAVFEKIPRLSAVNSNDSEKQLPAQAQRHRRLALVDNGAHSGLNIRLQSLLFRHSALDVGREPDPGQRPCFRKQGLRVKHCRCKIGMLY